MVQFINSWAQGIVIAIIIATIIEIILPEGNNKKYVKVVLGMYILFSVIYPVISNISKKNINIENLITSINRNMESYKDNQVTIETNSYIETTYKANLKEDIANKLNEKGYDVQDLQIYIESGDNERYGQINSMVLNIERMENIEKTDNKEDKKDTTEEKVKEVNIKISKTNEINEVKKIDEDKINNIKEFLEKSYGVEKERIHINEEDMYDK